MPTKITVLPKGPLIIEGDIPPITGVDGKPVATTGAKIALCRCGASKTKPFCDGSHKAEAARLD